ncbi:MAG: hypothetical protein WAU42_09320 [Solirubrobacteraceae bacterium]
MQETLARLLDVDMSGAAVGAMVHLVSAQFSASVVLATAVPTAVHEEPVAHDTPENRARSHGWNSNAHE